MVVKYGEITFMYEPSSMLTILFHAMIESCISFEETEYCASRYPNKGSIVTFENHVCELTQDNELFKDFKYLFEYTSYFTPSSFEKRLTDKKAVYFKKNGSQISNIHMFSNVSNLTSSYYTSLYYKEIDDVSKEMFGIVKLKSSVKNPRYMFAYESDEFSEKEVFYLLYVIFMQNIIKT